MKKQKYIEMNIDEMKQVKETWQIHLKIYSRKLRRLKNIEETKENRNDIYQLSMSYSYCINILSEVISIYKELINLGEMNELDETYFLKKIKEVQRLHANFKIEASKKQIKDLTFKFSLDQFSKKPNLNI